MPATGWGALPPFLPRGIFSRTLLYQEKIYLYAEFRDLQHIPHSDYLRQYIQQLLATASTNKPTANAAPDTSANTPARSQKSTQPEKSVGETPRAQSAPLTKPGPKPVETNPPAAATRPTHHTTLTPPTARALPSQPTPIRPVTNTRTQAAPTGTAMAADKPVVHTATPQRTHTASSATPRQREPERPAQAVTMDRHTTTSRATSETDNSGLFGGLLLLLLVGLCGGAIWYVLHDRTTKDITHAPQVTGAMQNAEEPGTSAAQPPLASPAAQAPQSDTTVSASENSHGDNANTNARPGPAPDTHDIPVASNTAKPPASADTAAKPASGNNDYQASIDKDAHGITITVDVPPERSRTPTEATTAATAETTVAAKSTHIPVMENTAPTTVPAATTKPPTEPTPPPDTVKTQIIIHIVVKGDTLWDIAKRYVKDPFRYPELARLSKIRNPDLIYPGDRVRIIKRIHDAN